MRNREEALEGFLEVVIDVSVKTHGLPIMTEDQRRLLARDIIENHAELMNLFHDYMVQNAGPMDEHEFHQFKESIGTEEFLNSEWVQRVRRNIGKASGEIAGIRKVAGGLTSTIGGFIKKTADGAADAYQAARVENSDELLNDVVTLVRTEPGLTEEQLVERITTEHRLSTKWAKTIMFKAKAKLASRG